jgi:hypothetical protein
MLFIVLFHLRRRHHHRWRSIWGIYQVRPWVHLGLVVPCLLGHHRCLVVRLGQVGLWVLEGRGLHLRLVHLGHLRVQLGHLRQVVLGLLGLVRLLWLGHRVVPSLRPCQVVPEVRWVRVGLGVQQRHLWLRCQQRQVGQVGLVLQVGLLGLVDLVGMACMVVV